MLLMLLMLLLLLFEDLRGETGSHGVLYDQSLSDVIKVRMRSAHGSWGSLVSLPPPEE